eukprot:TRINITY_DN755_c0_g3_i1.p1 TRINITY_DN755_c0_g3~~TRINITY_DN755_c0_g3_i1.p1  ORF type:complete len:984 (+),score=232.98 TRINITY_DN755_c0_g3_i1:38-2989(+)
MEVRLDALLGEASPKDTFVSMRIGDVQKQSRLAASRTYRFPDPGDNRNGFGRIEVFQRVGHMTVSFDSKTGKAQDVEVPCNFPGLDKLQLKLAVTGGGSMLREEIPVANKAKVKSKLDEAQKYLAKHKLEELLAEAMREVIHQKPDDPHSFLRNHIMKHAPSKDMPPPPPARVDEELGGAPAKAAAPEGALSNAVLRKQADDALLNAARDGSLERALAGVQNPPCDMEAMRAQAREALLRSARDGTLEAALGEAKASSTDVDTLRSAARNALLRSAQDGTLEAALSNAKASGKDVEALRTQARQALLRSAQDGSLEAALGQARGSKGSAMDIDELRMQARQALLNSAQNGALEAALAETKGSQLNTDVDTLRAQARQALLRSSQDGTLEVALSEAKGLSTKDVEVLRAQAKQSLLRSARDGTLEAALGDAKASSKSLFAGRPIDMPFGQYYKMNITPLPTSDLQSLYSKFPAKPKPATKTASARLETLCSQVQDALLRSAKNGTLKASLQGSCSDVDALRLQAKDALQRSANDGSLNGILREEQGSSMDHCALQSQANQALLRAAKDGSLSKTLADEWGSFTDMAALRSQAKEALLRSARDGTLQSALTANPDVSGLCSQVKDALLRSARAGSLKANLKSPEDIDQICMEARSALLRSARDGSLRASLLEATGGTADIEALRLKARKTLLRSARNGSLEAALGDAQGSSSTDIEALRLKAKKTLLRSAQNGNLEAVLGEARGGSSKVNPAMTINPMTVMSFDEIDINHDGKIDKDEWERAFAKGNAQATSPILDSESKAIHELQDTISKKDAEINALKELLRSRGLAIPAASQANDRPASLHPFSAYYVANFRQVQPSDLQNLYSKFPAKAKPKPCARSQKAAFNTTAFAVLPSVGTWLAKPFKPQVEPAKASAPILFNQKPSVATWFAFRPGGPERPRSVNVSGRSQEQLMTMKPEELIRGFQKEINRKDAEIKKLKQMLHL